MGSSAVWKHRIVLDDLVSSLEHDLHAAEASEGFQAKVDQFVIGLFPSLNHPLDIVCCAMFRYNNRENVDIFGTLIKGCEWPESAKRLDRDALA